MGEGARGARYAPLRYSVFWPLYRTERRYAMDGKGGGARKSRF